MKIIANVRVGEPDTTPSAPSHIKGVRQGNETGSFERQAGLRQVGNIGKSTARRSTGISPDSKNPIDPNSPNLTPP